MKFEIDVMQTGWDAGSNNNGYCTRASRVRLLPKTNQEKPHCYPSEWPVAKTSFTQRKLQRMIDDYSAQRKKTN